MRIVSLVPSLTETIYDLGLLKNIVGRTKFCVSPKNLHRQVPAIGGTKDPDIEKIVFLKPTHILMNSEENTLDIRNSLRAHPQLKHVLFYESFPKNIYDSITMVKELGDLFNQKSIALKWENQTQELLRKCEQACKKTVGHPKVYAYFIWRNPWMVAGQNTYIANMLTLIGFENAIQTSEQMHERYPAIETTDERLLQAHYLFFSSEPFPFKQKHINEFLSLNKGLANKQSLLVDGQLLSWYGTRSLQGLEYLINFHNVNNSYCLLPFA